MMLRTLQPIFLLALLGPGTAWASEVDRREDEARAACLSGDHGKGVAILSDLFVQTKDPAFIYNQGRCFQQNHRCEDAIARFEEFLRVGKKQSKADRAEAQQHIRDCQRSLDRKTPVAIPSVDAEGEKKASNEPKERAARKACLTGDPAAGVAILTDLYLDTKDATHIFNQGRCFEQNGRCEEAINRFREYLRKAPSLSAETKVDTEKHISDCQTLASQKPAPDMKSEVANAKAEPTREVKEVKGEPAVAARTDEPGTKSLVTTPGEQLPSSGRILRTAGIACGVVGLGSVATAIYFYTRARSYSDKVSNQDPVDPSDDSAGKTAETMQWVFYGVGGAALATGAVLYTLGWQSEHQHAAVAPMLGNGVVGFSAQGAF